MATTQDLKQGLAILFILLPLCVACGWSVSPAVKSWLATRTLAIDVQPYELQSPAGILEIKRTIQNHFRKYNVYIPTTDIVAVLDGYTNSQARLENLMRRACGTARLYVWVPLRYRLPVIGDRVSEWCWKPKVSIR